MARQWHTSTLRKVVKQLRQKGQEDVATRLLELAERLRESDEGASWFSRNAGKVRAVLSRHVENAGTELGETAHLLKVARQLLIERKPVGKEDLGLARTQLLDLLKTVPASAVFAGTFLIPLPGAQPILAPVLMERLGLLPSAWMESRVETELRDLIRLSHMRGLTEVAGELQQMLDRVRAQADDTGRLRKFIEENRDWAVFFDEDLNSRISDAELSHLRDRINEAARLAIADPDDPCWTVYFRGDGENDRIRRHLSFSQVRTGFPDGRSALIRRGDGDWWVPLWAVMELLG